MKGLDCIMLVDDDEVSNFLIKRSFDKIKACEEIVCFSNGKTALDHLILLLKTHKKIPDCILLDINMPVMDAFGFLAEICRIKGNINWEDRIVVISSTFVEKEVDILERLGFRKRLTKPVEASTLLELI